jgi:hypothetical protein
VENLLLSLPKRPDILAIQMAASFILLVLLAGVMFVVPPLQVAVSVASILTVLYFFTRPMFALFSIFCVRAVLDLLWWIPGTIAGLNMLQLFSAAVFVLVSTQLFLDLKRMQEHPMFQLFLGYLVLMVIATLRSEDIARNLDSIVRYTVPFILFFMVSIYFDRRDLRRTLLIVVACIGVIPLITSLYHMGSGQMNQYTLHGYNRLLGGYKNLHNMALMTLFFLTLWTFWLIQVRSMFQSLILLGLVGLGTIALYMSYIRTGVLGWAVFLGSVLLFQKRYRTLGVATALAALFIAFSADIQDRFSDLMLVFDDENIMLDKRKLGSGRWGMWSMSMKEFLDRPTWDLILGPGLGGQRIMTLDWVKLFHSKHITLDPHNDLLLLLYQIGPIGVLIYLAMQWKIFSIAREVWNMPEADRFAKSIAVYTAALSATVFVTNSVSNSFVHRTSPGWYYWCVCGILVAEYAALKRAHTPVPGKLTTVPEPTAA